MASVQDYDFELAHVAGVENIVSDQLSRLCPRAPAQPTPKLVQIAQLGQTTLDMPVTTLTALTTEELQGQEDQEEGEEGEPEEGFVNNEYEVDAAGRVASFVKNKPTKK